MKEKEKTMAKFNTLPEQILNNSDFSLFKSGLIEKTNKLDSKQRFETLMSQFTESIIIQLYDISIKIDPEFANIVTFDNIIVFYAPIQIKSAIAETLKIARGRAFGENEQQHFSDLIQKIFYENESYARKFA